MYKLGVAGYPVGHSKSPLIHETWFEYYGIAASYERLEISPYDLETGIKRLVCQHYLGFNVTVPHKKAMLSLCDNLDDTARAVGAVNTVLIDKDKKLHGFNTDVFGFLENIRRNCPGFKFSEKRTTVIGAGGASYAALYGLGLMQSKSVTVVNRTFEKAVIAAEQFNCRYARWEELDTVLENTDLLVNATSLGMKGQPPLDINLFPLPSQAVVNDLVYTPLTTPLIAKANDTGLRTVTGIGMLLYQAAAAFKIWFGIEPFIAEELTNKVVKD